MGHLSLVLYHTSIHSIRQFHTPTLTMAKLAFAVLSSALLLAVAAAGAMKKRDAVEDSCNSQCNLDCDVSLSSCLSVLGNDCDKDKLVCMEECVLECVCGENCLLGCLDAEKQCEADNAGLLSSALCKGKTAVSEASCPASCAVSTAAEATNDLKDLYRK